MYLAYKYLPAGSFVFYCYPNNESCDKLYFDTYVDEFISKGSFVFFIMNSEEISPESGATHIAGPYVLPEHTESFPLKQSLYGGPRQRKMQCCPCNMNDESSGLRVIITCFFILSVIITIALAAQIYFGDYQLVPHGSVAADSIECSAIGTNILKQGGNAVDAAVASTLCMGVAHPHVTGIGGGGFLLVYNHRKRTLLETIDFREVAPTNYFGTSGPTSEYGGQYAGVPGLVRGLSLAHTLHGKLKWKDVVMPSVLLARNGFPVSRNLLGAWKRVNPNTSYFAELQEVFGSLAPGEDLKLPDLAGALERIAILGPDGR